MPTNEQKEKEKNEQNECSDRKGFKQKFHWLREHLIFPIGWISQDDGPIPNGNIEKLSIKDMIGKVVVKIGFKFKF